MEYLDSNDDSETIEHLNSISDDACSVIEENSFVDNNRQKKIDRVESFNKFPSNRKRPLPRESTSNKLLQMAQIEALQSKKKLNDVKAEYYRKKVQLLN